MRILFLTDNFPPEVNAPANRTFEHCREWVRAGEQVTVITGAPNFPAGKLYPGYKNRLWQREWLDGIEVIRVWTFITANEGFLKRTADYISFALSAGIAGIFKRADIIVATSPQFFTAVAGASLGLIKRRPWVFEVRDLWPESIKAVGAVKDGPIIRGLEKLELFLYKHASRIVLVTESFKAKLAGRGVDESKMFVVKNGVNSELFYPRPQDLELKASLGLKDCFVVSYIGTLGMAHGLAAIVRAAATLPPDSPIRLLLIGNGAERANLERLKNELNADKVLILPPIKHEDIPAYFSITDASLVHLKRSDTFKEVLPSKIFEAAAMHTPIMLGVDGEARRLVENYRAGLFFEPESADGFVSLVQQLREDRMLYQELQHGAERLAGDFNRTTMAAKMLEILKETVERSGTCP